MNIIRWTLVVILILSMGYLSGFGLFADSSPAGMISVIAIFIAGCAAVGALIPERWKLAALCSWGAVLLAILELGYRLGREPVPGQQPLIQVLLTLLGAVGLALLGGYIGSRLRLGIKRG